jgi:folate-dependent phosphoribosylglycinamide formyltransferase PurN
MTEANYPRIFLIIQDEKEMMPAAAADIFSRYGKNIVGVMPVSPLWNTRKPLQALRYTLNLFGIAEFVSTGLRQVLPGRSVRAVCREYGVRLFDFQSPNSEEFRNMLRENEVDLLISYGCPIIIGRKTLQTPRLAAINVHGSYLPDFKGTYTVFYAMLRQAGRTGATVHRMTPEVDGGDYYYREQIPILAEDTLMGLYKKVERLGTGLLLRTLQDACEGKMQAYPMPEGGEVVTFPRWQDGVEFRRKGLRYR